MYQQVFLLDFLLPPQLPSDRTAVHVPPSPTHTLEEVWADKKKQNNTTQETKIPTSNHHSPATFESQTLLDPEIHLAQDSCRQKGYENVHLSKWEGRAGITRQPSPGTGIGGEGVAPELLESLEPAQKGGVGRKGGFRNQKCLFQVKGCSEMLEWASRQLEDD